MIAMTTAGMSRIKSDGSDFTIFFDFDGTLVDTVDGLVASANHVRVRSGLPVAPVDTVKSWIGGGLTVLLACALEVDNVPDDARQLFLDHYVGEPLLDSRPYQGIEAALDQLSGASLVIVTNKNRVSVERLVGHLGWIDIFDAVVCPDDGPFRKPDRAMIDFAWSRLGRDPGPAVLVGDSEFDIQAARNAGIGAVGVSWGFRSRDVLMDQRPDLLLDDVDQLTFDRLLGAVGQAA